MVEERTGLLGHLGVSLAFGVVVALVVIALGSISGAHINPAISAAFVLTRRLPAGELPAYVASQVVGATLAAATLRLVLGEHARLGATVPSGSALQSMSLESLLTAGLFFTIAAVVANPNAPGLAAAAIGGAVTLGALFGGPVSGGSMNPARSIGPALLTGTWDSHWIYWVGPIAGAAIGAVAHVLLFGQRVAREAGRSQ